MAKDIEHFFLHMFIGLLYLTLENGLFILLADLLIELFGIFFLIVRVVEGMKEHNSISFRHKEKWSYVSFAIKQIQTGMAMLVEISQTQTAITFVDLRLHMSTYMDTKA